MQRRNDLVLLVVVGSLALSLVVADRTCAEEKEWATIKGQVVWSGALPKQTPITITADKKVCEMSKLPLEEDYIINPKNKGVKEVFVWIRPKGAAKGAPFPAANIHPTLVAVRKDPLLIDQPCCKFEPHVLAAREGEKLIINGSPKIAHNANWNSETNGNINPLIPTGCKFQLPKPLVAEPSVILLACTIHPWMKCYVRVFDHPYYAITDDDGKFEIKLAPTGDYSLFVSHPATGWLGGAEGRNGKPLRITAKGVDLGELKFSKSSPK